MSLNESDISVGTEARRVAYVFYVMCDTSSSMFQLSAEDKAKQRRSKGNLLISATYAMLKELARNIEIRDLGHISILTFNDRLTVSLPLTRLSDWANDVPALTQGVFTDYERAWKEFSKIYISDLDKLALGNTLVCRPVVFFITDGIPETRHGRQRDDDWIPAYEHAFVGVDESLKPRIVALGLDDADAATLLKVHSTKPRHGRALLATRVDEVSSFIPSLVDAIQNSMRSSMIRGDFNFVAPPSMIDICRRERCGEL